MIRKIPVGDVACQAKDRPPYASSKAFLLHPSSFPGCLETVAEFDAAIEAGVAEPCAILNEPSAFEAY